MTYEEMIEILWKDRLVKDYDIENVEFGYSFDFGIFESGAVYYEGEDEGGWRAPLPLYLIQSDKWQLKNERRK